MAQMLSLKLKQVGLVLCVMLSLLAAGPSACACSHHESPESPVADCHSHQAQREVTAAASPDNGVGQQCSCVAAQQSRFVASRFASKELKPELSPAAGATSVAVAFANITLASSHDDFLGDGGSYSGSRRYLLRSRAPPRL
jgi:hypothetical protein